MSERQPIPRRKSSNSSTTSRTLLDGIRRESVTRNDRLNECKAAYLSVFKSTNEKITSVDELSLALQYGGRNPSKQILQKYWKNGTDSLSYHDFCEIMQKEKPTSKETLLKAFKKIDINGDGFITFDELSSLLTMRGERMTKAEVQTILDDADYNKDGKLDYNEFCNMLISTSEECTKKNMKKFGLKKDNRNVSTSGGGIARNEDRHISSPSRDKTEERFSSNSSLRERSEERKISMSSAKERSNSKKSMKKSSVSSLDRGNKMTKVEIEEPSNLKTWTNVQSKGSFFLEDDGTIVSHHYRLLVTKDSRIWLTIQPIPSRSAPSDLRLVDTEIFIIDEKNGEVAAFTAAKLGMKYCLQCTLTRGKYHLISFTTGCHLTARKYEPTKAAKLVQGSGDGMKLTQTFRTILTEIFTRSDLDSNGYLSRKEFDLFQMRTSGEHCDDDAWDVMKENFEMNGDEEITLKGFLDLNLMEAKDADGDPDDLWVTMESMGYNKALELDQSCSFYMDIFVKNCEPTLTVIGVDSCKEQLTKALATTAKQERIKGMKDLFLHKYQSSIRCSLIIENQSHHDITIRVNCSHSNNCISHRGELDLTLDIKAGEIEVAHHLVAEDSKKQWSVDYTLAIEK